MKNNTGILIAPPRPTDFVLGATSKVQEERVVKDWSVYLPSPEKQYSNKIDFLICATMSGPDHSIATQLNYLLFTNQLSDEALNFFHNERYIQDGVFTLSSRFNAKANGTDKTKGQYLNVAADSVRKVGFIAEAGWPTKEDMTWEDFYANIPVTVFEKAKKALWYVDIKYQWVRKENIPEALKIAPVQVGTAVCPGWGSEIVIPKCAGAPSHATLIYGQDDFMDWLDFDHYSPFQKTLSKEYELNYNLQYIVTARPLTLRTGMNGENVLKLQKDMNKLGFNLKEDSDFGFNTELAVTSLQNKTGLKADGIAGPKTLAKLKELIEMPKKTLVEALIEVESGGNDFAVGDKHLANKAYGCLQIRKPYCDDVNNYFGTRFKAIDCLGNRTLSLKIFDLYMQIYGKDKTDEQKARMHNAGPSGANIPHKNPLTEEKLQNYWRKVRRYLNE